MYSHPLLPAIRQYVLRRRYNRYYRYSLIFCVSVTHYGRICAIGPSRCAFGRLLVRFVASDRSRHNRLKAFTKI